MAGPAFFLSASTERDDRAEISSVLLKEKDMNCPNHPGQDGCECCAGCNQSLEASAPSSCPWPESHYPPQVATKDAELFRALEAGGDRAELL